jgi:dienelactone hydrolase
MKMIFVLTVIFLSENCLAQIDINGSAKPLIDANMLGTWPSLSNPILSKNGKYIAYVINNQPLKNGALVIHDIRTSEKVTFVSKSIEDDFFFFSSDSKKIIWKSFDTIWTYNVIDKNLACVTNIQVVKCPLNRGQWIAYQSAGDEGVLTLINLITDARYDYRGVNNFLFSNDGESLLFKRVSKKDSLSNEEVVHVKLQSHTCNVIWTSNVNMSIDGFTFDNSGKQIAFVVSSNKFNNNLSGIWYYKDGMKKSIIKVSDSFQIRAQSNQTLGGLSFSKNGMWLFFNVVIKDTQLSMNSNVLSSQLWSYRDRNFNEGPSMVNNVSGFVNVANNQVGYIGTGGETLVTPSFKITGDYAVFRNSQAAEDDAWWPHKMPTSYLVISLKTGKVETLTTKKNGQLTNFSFSPTGRLLTYWDTFQKNYFSYDLKVRKYCNLTKLLPMITNENGSSVNSYPEAEIAGWYKNDSALILYDRYDIWKINIRGNKAPINLTNGYGFKNHIKLRIIYEDADSYNKNIYTGQERLLLTGFSTLNKYNGFLKLDLSVNDRDPQCLIMAPYRFYMTESQKAHYYSFSVEGIRPLEFDGGNNKFWVIQRQNASSYPNYFLTTNFKSFDPLTELEPQRKYNWLTSELITWKQFDGKIAQGVLYKPENFDPNKKYPVIFNYYEKLSYRLYQFPFPGLTNENINIPWFVSRGYLVFTPDIQYSNASKSDQVVGDAVYNSLESAVQFLSKLKYVDDARIGAQGHSFGGGETFSLIVRSKSFAAAIATSSTVSDEISAYLGIKLVGINGRPTSYRINHAEAGHDMIGATFWQRPDLFIKASPVYSANKVSAPLFIIHNLGDIICDWNQSAEMFSALRRLNKPVWMIQYDGESHSIQKKKNALDYTLKINQFFDHYLKSAPAPIWMTQGIPARLKGAITSYDLDPFGNCGKDCKVCKMWNEKWKKDSVATMKEIQVKIKSEHWMGGGGL